MSLRDFFAELVGAEIQKHPVEFAGKTSQGYFRQISDAEGRHVFRVVEGESDTDRSARTMTELLEASVCDEHGNRLAAPGEVERMPGPFRLALMDGALKANNLKLVGDDAQGGEGSEGSEGSSPNA